MEIQSWSERRQNPRFVVAVDAYISGLNDTSSSQTVQVHDISLKGMAIHSAGLSLNIGDKISLCLSDDKRNCGMEHMITATVVNLRNNIAGLSFDSVGIYILKDLQKLLRKERTF